MDALGGSEPYTTVRCQAEHRGGICGAPLWRLYGDRIELSFKLNNRERTLTAIRRDMGHGVLHRCPRCQTEWWAIDPVNPRPAPIVSNVLKPVAA
jgi:hypothetical protein